MSSTLAKTATGIGKGNTKIWNDNGAYAVQLHDTMIYIETRDSITLNNGGWVTPTTARRMNQVLNHREVMGTVSIKNRVMQFNGTPFKADGTFSIKKVNA